MSETVRLSKRMSELGMCSRREADRFIEQGHVSVDGKVVSVLGTKVRQDQVITLDTDALRVQSRKITVLINKPPGYVSGLPEDGYQSAVMLITRKNAYHSRSNPPSREGLAPAGRLDIDSSGLIVFTDDGRVARKLIGADSEIEKEYMVSVVGKINKDKIDLLQHGLVLDDKPLRPAVINSLPHNKLRFVLTEGRKRQIRRMCELVDLEVKTLVRTRIGNIKLGDLPRGKWRFVGQNEAF